MARRDGPIMAIWQCCAVLYIYTNIYIYINRGVRQTQIVKTEVILRLTGVWLYIYIWYLRFVDILWWNHLWILLAITYRYQRAYNSQNDASSGIYYNLKNALVLLFCCLTPSLIVFIYKKIYFVSSQIIYVNRKCKI